MRRLFVFPSVVAFFVILLFFVVSGFEIAKAVAPVIDFEDPPYLTGTVHNQDGWSSSGSAGSGCAIYDHAVVANTYGYASFGLQSLRMSNAVTSGCFADHTFSKSLVNEAGETSAENGGLSGGVRTTYFAAQWEFASTVPGAEQPGLSVVASPDRGDGARMSWVQMTDTPSGLEVNFYDYQRSVGDFVFSNVASSLDRTVTHTIKIEMFFVDGSENDVVKVYVDGVLGHTGTSWEDYFRDEEGNPTRTVDSILFRTGGTAAPATLGDGFVIDNFGLVSDSVPQCTSTCYVDGATGSDGYGGTSIADAKKSIQAAIDAVSPGGVVRVLPGVYSETAANRFLFDGGGPYQFGLFIGQTKTGITVMGVTAGDVPITDPTATLATVNTNATNSFGYSGVFVEGNNVTLQGLKFGPNTAGDNKTIEIIGNAFALKYSKTAIPGGGGSVYFGDWRFNTGTTTSYIMSYTVESNHFDDGTQVAFSSGAGFSGPLSARKIMSNTFEAFTGQNWPHISFNGAGGVPWFTYPVGGAVIKSNSFTGSTQHIRARGDYTNSEMDWTSFWNDNAYDKAVVALIGAYPPFDVRTFSYVSGSYTFTDVRRIGAVIQGEVDIAQPTDTVLVRQGTYPEAVTINTSQITLQGATSDKTQYVVNGTGLGVNSGIVINNGVTGVTIKNLTVQNFTGTSGNANAGIYGVGGNNGLTVDNVALLNNPTASGFYANGPVDDVSVTNSMAVNNGGGARGIVIWNGLKTNITITGNVVTNNTCCGIELQDGTASGVNISGNTIDIGSGDNAIGVVGLNSSVGANIVNSNIITGGGRFGIEIKNPAGGVTVNGNQVTLSTQNADVRDRAGIAILRRGVLAGNVDVPNGVTITGNTVAGYQQTSTSEGFGIVVEGTNHTVTGNTVSSSDVGILQQQNPSGYSGDADQSNVVDLYFGRGNSPMTCGNTISGNTFAGNGVDTRNIGAGGGIVQNTNTSETFCSIQAAIDDSDTLAGHQLLLIAGVFSGTVTINKDVDIVGAGSGQDACVQNDYSGVSVLRAASGAVVTLAASGASTANPILLQNVRIEAVNQQAINVAPAASKVKLEGVKVMGSNPNSSATTEVGLRLGTAASITNLDVVNSSFNCLHFGWFFAQATTPSPADSITVSNTKWLSNTHRALYVEKLSNAIFQNSMVDYNGWFSGTGSLAFNGGFDINLKYGNYQNITLSGVTFTDNGNGKKEGAALSIKARDDAPSYNAQPATLSNVVITNSTFSNNERGIRFGEPGKVNTGPTNVKVQHNQITNNVKSYAGSDGSAYGGVIDHTSSPSIAVNRNALVGNTDVGITTASDATNTVDGKCNWWGDASGPGPVGPGSGSGVSANVTFSPFLLTSDLNGPCVPSVKIVKVVVGDPPATPWQFNGSGAMGTFTLPVAGGVKSFFDLGAGSFTISETPNPAYSSSVSCSNGATGGNSVSVTIAATDSISCTFTNTRQLVSITIQKRSTPQSPTNFRFTGSYLGGGSGSDSGSSIPGFYLDDPASNDGDAYGSSKSFAVPAGAVYSFSEPAVSGWYLMSITCDPAASATVNLATRSVTVNTSAGNDVTCIFDNAQAGVLNVRKHRESNGTLGQQAPEAFLSAWTIQVKTTPTGTLVSQAATNALGKVSFSLKPGNYQVCEVMKSGWKHWWNPTNLCFPVIVSAGGVTAQDFGNCPTASCPVSPSAVDGTTAPAAPALVLGADELEGWVEGWLTTPDGPVESENGELSEPDAGQRLYLPLITN